MKPALALIALVTAAPAFGSSFHCASPRQEIRGFIVVDGAAESVDALELTAWGKRYTDVITIDTSDAAIEVTVGATTKGTRVINDRKIELGFVGDNLKFDLFVARTNFHAPMTGRLVAIGKRSTTTLALTCKED